MGSSASPPRRDARQVLDDREAEDARNRIERRRARRRATDAADPRAAGAGALGYGGGCLAFTPALRQVSWPDRFRPGAAGMYDGNSNPREFL